jgi:hypothetical protein
MTNNQHRLHPAADIFRDHQLSAVEDENEMLRESNKLLESIFMAVELHLRDGCVTSTALTRSFVFNCQDNCCYNVGIPIDADESNPRPLSDFSEGSLQMMGRTIGTLPGPVTLLDIRANGAILLRISLSGQCAVEGVLRNLSVEDFAYFADKLYSNRQITLYLMKGVGLRNAASLTFTPMLFLLEISPMLQATLKFIGLLPSLESIKNDLMCHFAGVSNAIWSSEVFFTIFQNFPGLLSTVAAVGHTDAILGLLAENQLLNYDHCGLSRIQEMIGMVEIVHAGFNAVVSLKDGALHHHDGHSVWRNMITKEASPTSICRGSLTKIEVFLAGIPLPVTHFSLGLSLNGIDIDSIRATLGNGTKIHCRIYCSGFNFYHGPVGFVDISIDSPLSCVQNVLRMLGVDV